MKRVFNKLLITAIASMSLFATACSDDDGIVYTPTTRFLYSLDGGHNWDEPIQEIPVNQTYYLAIEMQIAQSKPTEEEKTVVAEVTIPNTNVLDVYLDDHPGITITGKTDPVTNSITYPFNIIAGVSPIKFRAVFECTPLAVGKTSIFVSYDDKVNPNWDMTGTIKYIEQTEDNGTSDSTTEIVVE